MILGVGIDHCQISRMEGALTRHVAGLIKRYFPGEVIYCSHSTHRRIARFAMHFAAKEATAKALGTGFCQGVSLSTIEVIHLPSGQPQIAVSLTDEADLASAICGIEAT